MREQLPDASQTRSRLPLIEVLQVALVSLFVVACTTGVTLVLGVGSGLVALGLSCLVVFVFLVEPWRPTR